MMDTTQLTKDIGSILVGHQAVDVGIIDAVGGIREALEKLHSMVDEKKKDESEQSVQSGNSKQCSCSCKE